MADISEFDKDQLAEYALSVYGKELDLRKSLDKLKAEVLTFSVTAKPKIETVQENPKATHILNRDTGMYFPMTDLLRQHLKNAVPCDKDGNPV
jgi:hypothetical protein